jgi:membrane-associated protease RseP (regulator of RpoE activity)
MSDQADFDRMTPTPAPWHTDEEFVIPTVVEEHGPEAGFPPPRRSQRRVLLPLLLFVATCLSTFLAGGHFGLFPGRDWFHWRVYFDYQDGLTYALLIMTILVFHEMGHFLQARRYGVRSSFPFFLPMPISPLGTLGAVIAMEPRIGDRKALFDIGITGPLAGLVPTLICCVVGVRLSQATPVGPNVIQFGDPLLLELLYRWQFGPLPAGWDVQLNPFLWAGWVGLLVTSLNLIPIGQLDGGHVLYALMRKRAHRVATWLLFAAAVAVIVFGYVWWILMLVLLMLMGPKHPPTAGDHVPLGTWRYVLGWLTLAFIAIGFTPKPFIAI